MHIESLTDHITPDQIEAFAGGRIAFAKATLSDFEGKFAADPVRALAYAGHAYEAAAAATVWTDLIAASKTAGGSFAALSRIADARAIEAADDTRQDEAPHMLTPFRRRAWAKIATELRAIERGQRPFTVPRSIH